MNTINISKLFAPILQWINKATDLKGSRSSLMNIKTLPDKRTLVATDGFRLHAVRTADEHDLPGNAIGRLLQRVARTAHLQEWEDRDETYPDVATIIPTTTPAVEFSADTKFLIEALQAAPIATIRIYSRNEPIEVLARDKDGNEFYSIVMPNYHKRKEDKPTWRPFQDGQGSGVL